jgi:hypothetical protein
LLLQDGKNGTGGIAKLELGGKWVYKEVVLRPFLVFVQGIIDDQLEIRVFRGRGGDGVGVRHGGERQQFVRVSEDNGGFVEIGQRGTARWAPTASWA